MPIPAIALAAGISGGSALIGSGLNAASQWLTNSSQLNQANLLYDKQRRDALQDFDKQNAYNSPVQQMQRLREAGLNPNLVYGSGAANTAAAVRSSTQQPYTPIAPKIDLESVGNTFGQYYQLKLQQAQTDNTRAATENTNKDSILKEANTANVLQNTATNKFQLEQAQRIKDLVYEKTMLDNEQKKMGLKLNDQELYLNLQKNEREKLSNSANVAMTLQSILNAKAQKDNTEQMTLNAKQQNVINDLAEKLSKQGIRPNDPAWMAKMIQTVNLLKDAKLTPMQKMFTPFGAIQKLIK